jgi:hypothetical protein
VLVEDIVGENGACDSKSSKSKEDCEEDDEEANELGCSGLKISEMTKEQRKEHKRKVKAEN